MNKSMNHGTTTNDALLSRLAALDAAPRTEPTAAGLDREETLLRTILDDTEPPGRSVGAAFRRPVVRRVSFTLAGALAAGLAVLTVVGGGVPGLGGSGPLSSAELASWTGTPKGLDTAGDEGSAAEKWCMDSAAEYGSGPAVVSNGDIRGSVASMVITRGGDAVYCLAASDGTGISMAISPVSDLPADGIDMDTLGARGEDDGQFNYALGSVGSDVEKVTVRDHGHTVLATIQDGRWTAWWPQGDPLGLITGTVTVTLTDGTTRTIEGPKL